jgi:hypothetical protein
MDIDLLIKAAVALFGAITAAKLLHEWMNSDRGRLREEYGFARTFLKEVAEDSQMHPYLIETGYQAIAGARNVTAEEVRGILGLVPNVPVTDYVYARDLLQFDKSLPAPFQFKPRYREESCRRRLKQLHLALYIVTAAIPVWLWVLVAMRVVHPANGLLLSGVLALGFWPVAYIALRAGARIARAERIVALTSVPPTLPPNSQPATHPTNPTAPTEGVTVHGPIAQVVPAEASR